MQNQTRETQAPEYGGKELMRVFVIFAFQLEASVPQTSPDETQRDQILQGGDCTAASAAELQCSACVVYVVCGRASVFGVCGNSRSSAKATGLVRNASMRLKVRMQGGSART